MNILDQVKNIPNGIQTVVSWLGEGAIPVAQELAQKRTDICNTCPNNVHGNPIIESVAEAIRKTVEIKNDLGLRTAGNKKLGTCSVCACALKLKVHVDIGVIRRSMTTDDLAKFPDFCWQVTEKP